MRYLSGLVGLGIAAVVYVTPARADPIIFNTEATFLSSVGDVQREGFEGFPTSGCGNGGTSISTSILTVTTTPQGGGTSWLCVGTAGWPGPTEGNNALIAGSNTGDPWILSFDLDQPTNAVYFELTDAVERGNAYISIPGYDDLLVASQGEGGLQIVRFGVVTQGYFSQFDLINTGFADGWGVDNMIFAVVPEPSTIALFATGLLGLGVLRRRRKSALGRD